MSGPKVGWWPGRAGRRGMQIRIRATGWAIIDSARLGSGPGGGRRGAGSRGPQGRRRWGARSLQARSTRSSLPGQRAPPARLLAPEDSQALGCSGCWLLGDPSPRVCGAQALRGRGRWRHWLPTLGGASHLSQGLKGPPLPKAPPPSQLQGPLGCRPGGSHHRRMSSPVLPAGRGSAPTPM